MWGGKTKEVKEISKGKIDPVILKSLHSNTLKGEMVLEYMGKLI